MRSTRRGRAGGDLRRPNQPRESRVFPHEEPRMFGSRTWPVGITLPCLAIAFLTAGACTSSDGSRKLPASGAAGTSSQAGTTGAAGTGVGTAGAGAAGTTGAAGDGGAAGTGAAGTSTGGTTGAAGNALDASTTTDAVAGTTGSDASTNTDGSTTPFDAAGRTPPTCTTPKANPNAGRASECDFLLQSLDFDDMYSYPSPPGSITVTNYGTALGAFEINNCGPYCYQKALTVGVDIVGGGDTTALQGEIIVHFPATGPGLPIDNAVGRDSLAWIELDGPTAPPFKITGQMVVETPAGIVTATETKALAYNNWLNYQAAEFKYFHVTGTTFSGP